MGVTVHLRRNRIEVRGYDKPKGQGWLPFAFMVYDQKTGRYVQDKTYSHILANGTVIVPRTADVELIKQRLRSQDIEFDGITDETDEDLIPAKPMSRAVKLKSGIEPKNEFQEEAVYFLTEKSTKRIHYRLLSLPTGDGKTFCAIAAMCAMGVKTLIVCNQLAKQWIDELLDKTNVHYSKLYEISGINTMEKLLSSKVNMHTYDIFVASLQTLVNSVEAGLYEEFCNKFGIGLKIVDEIHLATYSNLYLDMMAPIQETIYLSATPARSDPAEDYCLRKVFKELPEYGREVMQFKEKYLNVIYVFYDSKPNFREVRKCTSWYGFRTAAFAHHIFSPDNQEIVLSIIDWAISTSLPMIDKSEKIVVILELKEHVKLVKNFLEMRYPDVSIGDYTSNVDKKIKEESLDNQIILSTDSSFGTGSDLKGKLRVLVNTTTWCSKVTARQLPGRLRNIPGKSVYYIDLVNQGFKRTYDHYRMRSKIINSMCVSVTKRRFGSDI